MKIGKEFRNVALLPMMIGLSVLGGCGHQHAYETLRIEPTKVAQGYVLHTCSCGQNYRDGYTGIAGTEERADQKPYYRFLFVGNSMTDYNDLPVIFYSIALGEGYDLTVDKVTHGGWSISQLISEENTYGKTIQNKLNSGTVDIVIMQSATMEPIAHPGIFFDSCRSLSVMAGIAGAKSVLYQTIARKTGSPDLQGDLTNETMTKKVAAAYEAIGRELDIPVSKAGSAFYDVYVNHPEIELYNADMLHPSPEGSYLAALCHYATVYGKSPVGVQYTYRLKPETAKILQEAAHRTVFGSSIVTKEYEISSEGITG